MKILKNKKVFLPILGFVLAIIAFIGFSYSEILENDVEVEPNSYLTYYLDVNYDGVDRNGVESSDTTTAEINSGYINVSDKIPDGLTFEGFVATSDGSIGAVQRSDETISCLGKVVDDTEEDELTETTCENGNCYYHGLHYNESTRTVTFQVKNLKAGCKLTVGIITKTPATIDDPNTTEVEKRRDFYNYGTAKEDSLTVFSNTVHAFMGREDLLMHNVTYTYTGTVPSNAPAVPLQTSYVESATVGVAAPVEVEGYTFSGWTTTDVTVTDGSFTMPNSDVTFTGSFTEIEKNQVIYQIDGTTPSGYVKPSTKEYYPDTNVSLDSLKAGDVFNGYRFNGWTSTDVVLPNTSGETLRGGPVFSMPDHDVTIRGSFDEVTYTVTYAFYDTVLPPNSESLLPPVTSHKPGDRVTHPEINDPEGYKFLGWYKENNFIMPEENITIYGEWKVQTGTFAPTITKEVVGTKEYYHAGETVTFKITVTNTASFAIHDVMIKENNDNAYFADGEGYTVVSDHMAKIDNMASGATIELTSTYVVLTTDENKVINEAQLLGALADNHYELAEGDYKATAVFKVQSNLVVHHYIENGTTSVYEDEISDIVYGTEYETHYKESSALLPDYKDDYEYSNNHDGDPINGTVNKRSIEVTYFYKLKNSNYVVHYYEDGTTNSVCADITDTKAYRSNYEAHECAELDSNYRFKSVVSTDNNSVINNTDVTGTVKQDSIVITYYYERKPAKVITHHIDADTNNKIIDDVTVDYKYGNHYETSVGDVPHNYEFQRKTDNFEGIVGADTIEVTYYYQKMDEKLRTTITKTGTEEINSRDDIVKYTIKYTATLNAYSGNATITLVDTLPSKIDESKSDLAGGVYNEENRTVTWRETWSDINTDSSDQTKEITKTIKVKYYNYPGYGVLNNKVNGKIELSNSSRIVEATTSTLVKLPGQIIVHHYKQNTREKLANDIESIGTAGETYITKPVSIEGYKVSKAPNPETIKYTDGVVEVVYEYERLKYNITTEVVGGVGTITGGEVVAYGDDSKEDIIITPSDGYEIDRVIVNDVDAPITSKDKMILGHYKSVKNNIKVQVVFVEKPQEAPITGSNSLIYIIGAILFIISIFVINKVMFKDKNKALK